ncbi:histidinol-phosphatase [Amylibacter ulvae]|uniref:Histidinol-phosphatase n=1 Tax=Paramylibacter ulvae TaxID=1651968 RepID=A0ABQ3D767_9RHOB|nr:histidinol-phosphatase [Amylibacter ulvae]GHA62460.1 histidinol-phosphatase [Amylibacter ulvae]
MQQPSQLQIELMTVAHELADAARPIALHFFRKSAQGLENKLSDGFDPVTLADREIEQAMRDILTVQRPDDGILGEEFPDIPSQSGLTWVLDPIDGTRGFISGTPTWGVLIAINDGDAPVFGIVDQPFTGERYCGGFGTALLRHAGREMPLGTRKTTTLSESVIFTTFPEVGSKQEGEAFHAVAKQCKLTRYGMDCYAYALLAAGQVDLVIEAGLNPYDIQGPLAVIAAAGGIVTDWQGGDAQHGGRVIAAANATIHSQALEILARY